MALICLEGFDHLDVYDSIDGSKGWVLPAPSTYIQVGASQARFSGQGLATSHSYYSKLTKDLGANYTTIYFGIAFKQVQAGTPAAATGEPLMRFKDESSVAQINICVTAAFALNVYRGTTLLGSTSDGVIEYNQWAYLEGKITIDNAAGEVTLKIGGTQVLSLTSQDTKAGSDYIRKLMINAIYSDLTVYWDDLYVDDSQFNGDCQVKTFMPDSDSVTHTDFERSTGSNDYECVDETIANDDTDYIKSSTSGHISTFGITTGSLNTVKGIQVVNRVRTTSAGVRKIKSIVRSNGADYQGSESAALSGTYLCDNDRWDTDPDDSNPWTQTKLEAAEFGLEITD
jgi:hypothetical protein